ncbi:transposase [Pseudodesulfovibrio sediminis]|uniref:transposase n=1 Tax=Pseudodesulfovibrio sediminis TaxID=2810563 RepID=UPI003D31D37E
MLVVWAMKETGSGHQMPPPEQILFKLREADVALTQGTRVADACRQLGIPEQTYYRWRKEYGGLKTSQARQLIAVGERTPDLRSSLPTSVWISKSFQRRSRETSKP